MNTGFLTTGEKIPGGFFDGKRFQGDFLMGKDSRGIFGDFLRTASSAAP
jgi:hypothetical protein